MLCPRTQCPSTCNEPLQPWWARWKCMVDGTKSMRWARRGRGFEYTSFALLVSRPCRVLGRDIVPSFLSPRVLCRCSLLLDLCLSFHATPSPSRLILILHVASTSPSCALEFGLCLRTRPFTFTHTANSRTSSFAVAVARAYTASSVLHISPHSRIETASPTANDHGVSKAMRQLAFIEYHWTTAR
jgi:hypothetical protein